MKRNVMTVMAAGLLTAAGLPGAHAARLQLVGLGEGFDLVLASATVGGQMHDLVLGDSLTDLSSAQELGRAGAGWTTLPAGAGEGGAEVGWDGGLFAGNRPDGVAHVTTYTSASLTAQGPAPLAADGAGVSAEVGVIGLQWRVVGDAGEAAGALVDVHFAGLAHTFATSDFAQVTPGWGGASGLQVSIDGVDVLGAWFDVTQAVSLRFQARVGELLTVSAFSRAQMDSAVGDTLLAGQGYGAAAGLQGTFSVTSAVPEPASVALVLAGLAVVAALTRRRPR